MRTYFAPSGTVFLYNSDLSGDAVLTRHVGHGEVRLARCTVPLGDVLAFAAECVRDARIEALEDEDHATILGLPLPAAVAAGLIPRTG